MKPYMMAKLKANQSALLTIDLYIPEGCNPQTLCLAFYLEEPENGRVPSRRIGELMTADITVKKCDNLKELAVSQQIVPQPEVKHSQMDEGVNMDQMLEGAVKLELKNLGSLEECL